jgi:hypothetical protein
MRILFLLLCLGFASAQELPCAALLEALPNTRFNELTSFEAIFSFQENGEIYRVRQIEGVTNDRSYYEFLDGPSGETRIARYEGDAGTLEINGQTEVAPPETEVDLVGFFDVFLSQKIFSASELVSCDGVQTLQTPEGSVSGEAISLIIMDDPGQLFFDDNGHVIAFAADDEVGVFENQYEDNLLVKSAFKIYSVETKEQLRTMTFELVAYDQDVGDVFSTQTLACEGLLETFKIQPEFTSLETTTTYADQDTTDYRVVDFTNERAYWKVTIMDETQIFRLVNGEVTGTTETGESVEVPEGLRFSLESTFSASASFRDLAEKAVILSCDGEQSYSDATGEVVRGQQITVADKTDPESESAKLLFDTEGNYIGNYIDRPDDDDFLIVNSGIKKDGAGMIIEVTMSNYVGENGAFELLSKMTTKTLSYNQPVDETLFEP